jgi:hypothetical protein
MIEELYTPLWDDEYFRLVCIDLGDDPGPEYRWVFKQCRRPLWWDDASYLAYQSMP